MYVKVCGITQLEDAQAAIAAGADALGFNFVPQSKRRVELESAREIIAADPQVEQVGRLATMQLGPSDVLLAADIRFRRGLSMDDVDHSIARVEGAVRSRYPAVRRIFVRPVGMDAAHDAW